MQPSTPSPDEVLAAARAEQGRLARLHADYNARAIAARKSARRLFTHAIAEAEEERPTNAETALEEMRRHQAEHFGLSKIADHILRIRIPAAQIAEIKAHIAERKSAAKTLYAEGLAARRALRDRAKALLQPGEGDVDLGLTNHKSTVLMNKAMDIDGGRQVEIKGDDGKIRVVKKRSEVDLLNEELSKLEIDYATALQAMDAAGTFNV